MYFLLRDLSHLCSSGLMTPSPSAVVFKWELYLMGCSIWTLVLSWGLLGRFRRHALAGGSMLLGDILCLCLIPFSLCFVLEVWRCSLQASSPAATSPAAMTDACSLKPEPEWSFFISYFGAKVFIYRDRKVTDTVIWRAGFLYQLPVGGSDTQSSAEYSDKVKHPEVIQA